MTVLVTGVAGFIGFHVARALLDRGETVLGIDNLSDYYSVALKRARLAELDGRPGYAFRLVDLTDAAALAEAVAAIRIRRVVHLAAQPGVRYSIDHPEAYVQANVVGHLAVLELCRHADALDHAVYASSSSVYGGSEALPYSEDDRADRPISLYAATKRADEMMSHAYAHLYSVPLTGLRFFTVYGPWGRPDMAVWRFTEAILTGAPIRVTGDGAARRDFTFIDDVVEGVLAVLDGPPPRSVGAAPHRIYNIGNNRPEDLRRLVELIEQAAGRQARWRHEPPVPGDMHATYADIGRIARDFGFTPRTPLSEGVPRFVEWYRGYRGI